ncbi:DUF6758 family protein [Nocardioides sp. SYSU DS0663]|uniref:DUF6758 family protein n=1 Tax=Nocardioides sp. SYSU DS0663 TaxID=3416445 RepID=UPI003F4B49AC
MSLTAGCPRCPTPVAPAPEGRWACPDHGVLEPLWRPAEASYEGFHEHLQASRGFPTYLPWPMSPGWSVTDFGVVGSDPERARATMTCCSGTSELDGPVDVLVVVEEAGTGLGGRCAGTPYDDPGLDAVEGPPAVQVRTDGQAVRLWPVSTSAASGEWDRSVVAGEAGGRWLWLVLRPASAMLLLRDDWLLRDVSALGPALVEMPFGGPRPSW